MSRPLKIAVADDERDLRDYLQSVLARLGHQVRAAEDGHRLLGVCRDFSPDVIVTDLSMPGVDGLTAAAEVNRERAVPVILLSADPSAASLARAASCVVACLVKPLRLAELQVAIESAARCLGGPFPVEEHPGTDAALQDATLRTADAPMPLAVGARG